METNIEKRTDNPPISLPVFKILLNGGNIKYSFVMLFKDEGNFITSYIPIYNLRFSSKTMEEAEKKAKAMMNSFYNYYVKNEGWKKFILKIHTMGFRTTNHDLAIKELLNNRPVKKKFNSPSIMEPADFNTNMQGVKIKNMEESISA